MSEPASACPEGALMLELPRPDPGPRAARAWFEVDRGDSMYGNPVAYRWTCVTVGDRTVAVAPRSRLVVPIAADLAHLQRVMVDGKPILAHVAPEAHVALLDQPCFGWELYSEASSDWHAGSADAYCTEPDAQCVAGFGPASSPSLARDPLCPERGDDYQRCVRLGQIRLAPAGDTTWPERVTAASDAEPIAIAELAASPATMVAPTGCMLPEIDTGTEVVGLWIAPGQRWSVEVDETGRLTGTSASR